MWHNRVLWIYLSIYHATRHLFISSLKLAAATFELNKRKAKMCFLISLKMVIESRYIWTCSKQWSITLHYVSHSFVLLHCLVSTAFYFHITCIPSSTWSFMVICCNRIFSGALHWWGVNFLYLCDCFPSAASQAHGVTLGVILCWAWSWARWSL